MKKYLVTGGAGFIGSHLAEDLVKAGNAVRILDNFLTGKEENLSSFRDDVELVRGDIRDLGVCKKAVKGVDYVLHQAALPSVPRSIEDPALTNAINIIGTLHILLAARDEGVQKVVFASSSSVYGDNPELPKRESAEGYPLSPYAVTKIAGEKYCRVFNQVYGLPTVCLRYFNVFGPRQDPHSQYAAVIPNFITKLLKGESPVICGDGEQSRDFTYVANVVEANILAAGATCGPGAVFNVGYGSQTSVNSLALTLARIMKVAVPPLYEEQRPGDIRHSFADISKAKNELKYKPQVQLEEGLALTVAWFSGLA